MNKLSIIVTLYNSEEYISDCIDHIKRQRNQNFDLIIVNDGSTDDSKILLDEALKDYKKDVKYIYLANNHGHAYARNVGIANVKTPYFMFVDSDDKLTTYAINFYLKHLNGLDALIAPVHDFSLQIPQYVDKNKVQIHYYNIKNNANSFLRKNTVCNIVFKTGIVKGHNIKFNENLKVYSDWSFILEYMQYANEFVRITKFPFYFKGEVYDPFETNTLSEQNFDILFEDYAKSFIDSLSRVKDSNVRYFIKKKMLEKLHTEFTPNLKATPSRYETHKHQLHYVSRKLGISIVKEKKILFAFEMFALMIKRPKLASKINKLRFITRHIKRILLRQKGYSRSKYFLSDKEQNVDNKTIVFESFGGKNYSDSPKYIYEYMKDTYPELKYKWIFKDPENNDSPHSVVKVKKETDAYYKAYSEAKFWVTNARLPLYLNKKPNQIYIQTWHGTPLKRLANDMKVVRMPGTTTSLYKKNFHAEASRWDYLISPNHYSTEIFRTAFWMSTDDILEIGYPRNDILVKKSNDEKLKANIREDLNIPLNKKIIMYAPTWRDDEFIKKGKYTFDLKIDLPRLKKELGDEYVILLRMHYLIANALDLNGYEDFAYDVSNYSDISELYLISDCLITDYSSVMFDYGILKRPQFFFAYDIEKYDKNLRGFYIDYHNDLPGPIYTDPVELIAGLKNIDQIKKDYKKNIDTFYNRFCSIENGKASKFIGDMIYQEIKKNEG
ncbi:bifunctional glycosyltransferase/CDP-glycerol:glycerophosphate glycerophosphotransferase [Staphylococcus felis]|uniref:bifunctional glycosyltransferase/CDP-glycerol:glycerophosphate glycerophosphotransferase n=1 Tax=Staphylococcus felis TaxID=46127 RepID=UPI000CD0C2EB|nr:bifunctional glycosyltransferase family 2 protein/CDP-glycerol:glycerophosphate glycerophosphotransferase [Staphylococcus felis]AVP36241.1 CDP-glycerol:glycerophosphate glycerophosphotransferase [Staphylococcus felis]PNZ36284.1 CDP-glycerol:glycerophosphate glycerophosphotransferase [Staphylococcus felis]QQB03791.1 CDP-glycerol glycerophosphotransferase family protein [Staphylococcus felis]